MVEHLILLEIMELNTEMSSMNITGTPSGMPNHNLIAESACENQKNSERNEIYYNNGIQRVLPGEANLNTMDLITETVEVNEFESKSKPRRSLRKRIRPLDNQSNKLRDSAKMQKMNDDVNDIEKYYLSKKVKRLPSTLETIFEEPKGQIDKQQFVSTRKFKRTLHFDEDLAGASRLKLRKRQLKARKLPSSKNFLNRKKVSMDTLLNKLSSIESLESDKE